jgi:hypothetical protein
VIASNSFAALVSLAQAAMRSGAARKEFDFGYQAPSRFRFAVGVVNLWIDP